VVLSAAKTKVRTSAQGNDTVIPVRSPGGLNRGKDEKIV
jgi:hypothetical protein